jgi:hypothetical protein
MTYSHRCIDRDNLLGYILLFTAYLDVVTYINLLRYQHIIMGLSLF